MMTHGSVDDSSPAQHWFSLLSAAFRCSLSWSSILWCSLALWLTSWGWQAAGWCWLDRTLPDAQAPAWQFHQSATAWEDVQLVAVRGWLRAVPWPQGPAPVDPVIGVPYRFVEPVRRLLHVDTDWRSRGYYLMGGCWSLFVWALAGGCVTRFAIFKLARGEGLPGSRLWKFARPRWLAYFGGPGLVLVGIGTLALPFVGLGFLMRTDVGVFLGGLLWGGVLLAAGIMAILALGLFWGWPFMWGTISSEASDSFDAISRSYAYVFQRPLHYARYLIVASLLGWMGWWLAWWFVEMTLQLAIWSVSLGAGASRTAVLEPSAVPHTSGTVLPGSMSFTLGTGLGGLAGWASLLRLAAAGFAYAYFWTATAAMYLLLRRDTDETPIADVYVDGKVLSKADLHSEDENVTAVAET